MHLTTKHKTIIAILVFITVLILLWQAWGLLQYMNNPNSSVSAHKIVTPVQTTHLTEIQLSDSQRAYLNLLNQYKLTQLQRLIAENNAAIAEARLAAAQALLNLNKLPTTTSNGSVQTTVNNTIKLTAYQLLQLVQTQGHWFATLKNGDQVYPIIEGTILNDNTQVLSISKNGVILQQDVNKVLVSKQGTIQLNAPKPAVSKKA